MEINPCPMCGSKNVKSLEVNCSYIVACDDCKIETVRFDSEAEAIKAWNDGFRFVDKAQDKEIQYPQDQEKNEYRYISPEWLDSVARGLTAGAVKHPGETWRTIPSREHAARALRHLNLFLMGDTADDHIVNASMRVMMAFETAMAEGQREEWEKLMRDMESGRL